MIMLGSFGAVTATAPTSDISRTKPLIRLILNQIGRRLTEEFCKFSPATG
jgi:type IV secretory pathway TraG/TraD family ATPase VirD4